MKIILIDPGSSFNPENFSFEKFVNIGLLSIATFLKQNNINPIYLTFDYYYKLQQDPFKILLETVNKENPELAAISNLFIHQFNFTLKIARFLKEHFPKIKIVFGGMKPSFEHEEIMSKHNRYIDFIIRGEGEWTLKNLVESIYKGGNYHHIKGITYFKDNKVIKNEDPPMGNLDELPLLDYSILPKDYIICKNPPNINILISRGCFYNCSFCSVSLFWKKRREYNLQKVLKELQSLSKIGYSGIIALEESSIDLKNRDMKKFLTEIEKLEKNFFLDYLVTHVNLVDESGLNLLKSAKINTVIYGVESFAKSVLDKVGKNITKKGIIKALKLSKKAKLFTSIFIVLGLPGENPQTLELTYKNVKKLFDSQLLDSVFVSNFYPFPQTKAKYEFLKLNGKFLYTDDQEWRWRKEPHIEYPGILTSETLKQYMEKYDDLNLRFLGDLKVFKEKEFHRKTNDINIYSGVLYNTPPKFTETIRRLTLFENRDVLIFIGIESLNKISVYSNKVNFAFERVIKYIKSKILTESTTLNPQCNGKYFEIKVEGSAIKKTIDDLNKILG